MEGDDVDITTALRSEVAGLQCKKERLKEELAEMQCQMRAREQRCHELQHESDQLREQTARQNAIITSLKKRIHDLEERERDLHATHGRSEIALQSLQRDNKYQEDRIKDLEKKIRCLEQDLTSEEQKKEAARCSFQELVRRLALALGSDCCDSSHMSAESLVHKASELVQETTRLKTRTSNVADSLVEVEHELRSCRETLDRALADKECLQRQSASQILELDRLRQDKEALEMQQRVSEREIGELRDKLACSNRSLGSASGNIAQQESQICQLRGPYFFGSKQTFRAFSQKFRSRFLQVLRNCILQFELFWLSDELKQREEKCQRLQHEHRHVLETISILLSTPARFVESAETAIKDRIREMLTDNKDKCAVSPPELLLLSLGRLTCSCLQLSASPTPE